MNRNAIVHLTGIALVCGLAASPAGAQETRAALTSGERAAKAADAPAAAAPERGRFARAFRWATTRMDRPGGGKDGVRADFGDLIPGSGLLAGGAGYRHHLFGDAALIDVSASGSIRRYSAVQSTLMWPQLFGGRVAVAAQIKRQDFTQVSYFGIGPDTSKAAQTDYRLQNVDVLGSVTARPRSWLAIGGRGGYLRGPGVMPGLSALHPSTLERFDETSAPGLMAQPRYAHADAFIETDWRDAAGYPTRGGVYRAGLAEFHDLDGSRHGFRRVDMDATQYLPLFHQKGAIALRGRMTLSQTAAGDTIPFYLLPTLGGGNTLRGYSEFRFRDRNAALVSAEYRWPLFRMLDAAVFVDAGRVAPMAGALWQARLRRDYGLGMRVHSDSRSIARLDVAKGSEGYHVLASVSAPLGASRRSVTPYVP